MSAAIVINDGTNPPVTGSVDLDVSFLATAFTLSNFNDSAVLGWQWTLLDKPIGSAASLTTPTLATTQITPDIEGTYLFRLQTYTDVGRTILDDADEQLIGIRFATPRDWLIPAAGQTTQLGAGRGWANQVNELLRDARLTTDFNAIHDNIAAEISAITAKATPVAADVILIEDSAAGDVKKRITLGSIDHDALTNFVAAEHIDWTQPGAGTIHTDNYIEGMADADAIHDNVASEISAITAKATPVAGDFLIIEDSAAANVKKSITLGSIDHDALTNFLAAEHVDWAGASAGTIHATNYIAGGAGTDTTAIHDDTAGEINAVTLKGTPVAADVILIEDSAAGFAKKRTTLTDLLTVAAHPDPHLLGDGAVGAPTYSFSSASNTGGWLTGGGRYQISHLGEVVLDTGIHDLPDASGVLDLAKFEFDATAQATGGDGWRALVVNMAGAGFGSGIRNLLDLQVAGTTLWSISNSGRTYASNGTLAAPSYSFIGQTGYGLWSEGSGNLVLNGNSSFKYYLGGTHRITHSVTNFAPNTDSAVDLGVSPQHWRDVYADTLQMDNGTAALPSHSFDSAPNTGLSYSTTGGPTLVASVEGAAAMSIRRVLDAATTAETAFDLAFTVNKAENDLGWTGLKLNATITNDDSTAVNRIADFQVNSVTAIEFEYVQAITSPSIKLYDPTATNDDTAQITTYGITYGGSDNDFSVSGFTAAVDTAGKGANYFGAAGGAASATVGGAGGRVDVKSGIGGAAASTFNGGAGGVLTLQAEDGGSVTGSGTGGVGGHLHVIAGKGGSFATAGGGEFGFGGNVYVKGGEGASETPGTPIAGSGGGVLIDAGEGGASGADGNISIGTLQALEILSGNTTNRDTMWRHRGPFTYIPKQTETSATTLSVDDGDDGTEFYHTNTASCTVTVDQGVAGTRTKHVAMDASNTVTFAAGSGVSLRRPATFTLVSNEQYSTMYLYWRTATEVFLEGDLGIA